MPMPRIVVGRSGIHRHDVDLINGGDFAGACLNRVSTWINEFGERYVQMLDGPASPSN
jgi:hypothetical protein